jgi:PIN domain nuclease of toxin-antitoxin system
MAAILLDTNALYYYATGSSKFGARTRKLLDQSDLLFSPLSLVELRQKILKGKLALSRSDSGSFEALGIRPASFTTDAANAFALVANDDPFDNMLLAQAKALGASFLTADLKVLRLGLDYVLDLTD